MEKRSEVTYATHDGVTLIGDFYLPDGPGQHPALVAVHGGGWQGSDRNNYQYLGPVLAEQGIAVFTIEYRLAKAGQPSYPGAVGDVRAAVQFVRGNAGAFGVDPARIGMIGDSAGAHLASLVALAGNRPAFAGLYAEDRFAAESAAVKAIVGFYGVYDVAAQWDHDALARPFDQITEKFLGVPPAENRQIYFESSPLSYAVRANNKTAFLLAYGTEDDIVDRSQSEAFLLALKQAQFFARQCVIQGAGHFWSSFPIEEEDGAMRRFLPHLARFLTEKL
jgi:acetyl esterase/lipase